MARPTHVGLIGIESWCALLAKPALSRIDKVQARTAGIDTKST